MHQYSVCRLRSVRAGRSERLVVVLQHDILSGLRTRLVAPLLRPAEVDLLDRLTPKVAFRNDVYWIGLHQMVTVDTSAIVEVIGSIDAHDDVIRGIDLLFTGF